MGRLAKIESTLDSVQALIDLVHALMRDGIVAVETRDLRLQRREPELHRAKVFGHLIDTSANVSEMFEDYVFHNLCNADAPHYQRPSISPGLWPQIRSQLLS